MRKRKSFHTQYRSSIVAAMILFACTTMLNAQPFTKITTGQIATDVRDASGASWIDYDNDGDLDLFTSNRAVGNYLYRNEGNGNFPRVNAGSLTTINSIGNSWADYDNDGDLDAFTVGFSSVLHRNQGNGTFVNVTTNALGLATTSLVG
ncbi:MAG: VCBS repeat-containing protein, partial [candidate division KSB1 bacterium]